MDGVPTAAGFAEKVALHIFGTAAKEPPSPPRETGKVEEEYSHFFVIHCCPARMHAEKGSRLQLTWGKRSCRAQRPLPSTTDLGTLDCLACCDDGPYRSRVHGRYPMLYIQSINHAFPYRTTTALPADTYRIQWPSRSHADSETRKGIRQARPRKEGRRTDRLER